MIENYYKQGNPSLEYKYNQLFEKPAFDYEFYSYMRHCGRKSPFIDFTKSASVALIFAFYNKNGLLHLKKDKALYLLSKSPKSLKNSRQNKISKFNIEFLQRIQVNSTIFGKNLWELKSNDFKSNFIVLNEQTNDRMKVQKGLFLCLEKGIIVNGYIFIYTNDVHLIKLKIKKEYIRKLKNYIIKNFPQYKYANLINPYKYIEK